MAKKQDDTTRNILLATATRLFFENGYEKTSIRSIAKESNIGSGLFSYYFKTKENLVNEILNTSFSSLDIHLDLISNNAIEDLFIFLLLGEAEINKDIKKRNFFNEILRRDVLSFNPSNKILDLIYKICNENNIAYIKEDIYIYATSLRGVERILHQQSHEKKLNITYLKLNKILTQTILLPLGISLEKIDASYENVLSKLDKEIISLLDVYI